MSNGSACPRKADGHGTRHGLWTLDFGPWTRGLVRHVVRVQRGRSANRRAGRCNHRGAHRSAHRHSRGRSVVRATGRHSEQALCILSASGLRPLLHKARRASARIRTNARFGKRIVNAERSFIGVILRRHEVGQPRPLAAGRENQAQSPRHNAANCSMMGVQQTDASGMHVSILRDGILRDDRPRRRFAARACG